MKNNVFRIIIVILIIAIIIGLITYYVLKNKQPKEEFAEYIPQEEITDEQLRQTVVSIYFKFPETNSLVAEAKLIDAKLLLNDPYTKLIELLLAGPKNESLVATIPEGVKLNSINLQGETVVVDLSEEFLKINEYEESEKELALNSIEKTLQELNEVATVVIQVNGETF